MQLACNVQIGSQSLVGVDDRVSRAKIGLLLRHSSKLLLGSCLVLVVIGFLSRWHHVHVLVLHLRNCLDLLLVQLVHRGRPMVLVEVWRGARISRSARRCQLRRELHLRVVARAAVTHRCDGVVVAIRFRYRVHRCCVCSCWCGALSFLRVHWRQGTRASRIHWHSLLLHAS